MSSVDPVTGLITQARGRGWVIMPHLTAQHDIEHVLIRTQSAVTDLITLPADGLSQVARLDGRFDPACPLRVPVVRWVRHVPTELALAWAIGAVTDDDLAATAGAVWVDPPLFTTRWQRGLWTDRRSPGWP